MIVTVCGLHGGAGTTTIAHLLAVAAAQASPSPGTVLLCDSSPTAGDLALTLGAASTHNLSELAHLRHRGQQPTTTPWADLPDGTRLLARAPGSRAPAPQGAIADVLADAAHAHQLVVVDAGALGHGQADGALRAANHVIWTIDATASLSRSAHMLSSELAHSARDARWTLVASTTARDAAALGADQLQALIPSADHVVLVAAQRQASEEVRAAAAADLLSAIS